jgi:hypothetical protein
MMRMVICLKIHEKLEQVEELFLSAIDCTEGQW